MKQIERRAWTSYFEDGLWDIFFGLLLLTGGIRALVDNVWISVVYVAVVFIPIAGRKIITEPRLGIVKFGPARKRKQRTLTTVILVAVLTTLALLFLTLRGFHPSEVLASAAVGSGLMLIFVLLAYYMDFERIYLYGALFAIGAAVWEAFGGAAGAAVFCASGAVALIVGAILLHRFSRKYPEPAEGAPDGTA